MVSRRRRAGAPSADIVVLPSRRCDATFRRWNSMTTRTRLGRRLIAFLSLACMAIASPSAFALITGGEGNAPLNDPGWPKGAITLFNVTARIAWWEGPPFGGGQWHPQCPGESQAL